MPGLYRDVTDERDDGETNGEETGKLDKVVDVAVELLDALLS